MNYFSISSLFDQCMFSVYCSLNSCDKDRNHSSKRKKVKRYLNLTRDRGGYLMISYGVSETHSKTNPNT